MASWVNTVKWVAYVGSFAGRSTLQATIASRHRSGCVVIKEALCFIAVLSDYYQVTRPNRLYGRPHLTKMQSVDVVDFSVAGPRPTGRVVRIKLKTESSGQGNSPSNNNALKATKTTGQCFSPIVRSGRR